jgi:hypothetical protein
VVARLLGLRVRISPGAWMFVKKKKGKMQDNPDKETRMNKVPKKCCWGVWMFVVCVVR